MTIKIGFSGTQRGMTEDQRSRVIEIIDELTAGYFDGDEYTETFEFHMGDCIGADKDFYDIVSNYRTVGHPPDNPAKRTFLSYDEERSPKSYLVRNEDIADECELLIATPKEFKEVLRSGTWSTIRYFKKRHKSVYVVYPNGIYDIVIDMWRQP